MSAFEITYAQYSDIGDRVINEDMLGAFSNEQHSCFILCDGLGGHGMGDVASSIVVQVFESQYKSLVEPKTAIRSSFLAAQDILLAEQKTRNAKGKMKTTAVSLQFDSKFAYIGHVGDSRAYVFKNGRMVKRTLDHSIPQMLAIAGDIKENEIRNHPERNIVLRVMGTEWDEPLYDLMAPIRLRRGMSFLLCSDGFWELIKEAEMCDNLRSSSSVDEWLRKMQEHVLSAETKSEKDNNSAIAVWCR